MDMGFKRTLGLGALSLRALVRLQRRLVMVAGAGVCRLLSDLGARICLLLRLGRRWIWSWFRLRLGACWLAAHRAGRLVSPMVGPLGRRIRCSGIQSNQYVPRRLRSPGTRQLAPVLEL